MYEQLYCGLKWINPYLSAEYYIYKVIPVVKKFYDLSKYYRNKPLPRNYNWELYTSIFINEDGVSM